MEPEFNLSSAKAGQPAVFSILHRRCLGTIASPFPLRGMETARRSIGTFLVIAVLLGLLAGVGWFAFAGITAPGEPLPSEAYVALALGALTAVLVGIGLMTLVFYSSRRGYDEPPRFHEDQ
jgi:cation transporter-like permease